jgi:hypothetical protein
MIPENPDAACDRLVSAYRTVEAEEFSGPNFAGISGGQIGILFL